jgi:putative membrane protein
MSDLNDPRVLFAAERTLLAWNRTSLSLMAFGFVIERFGLFLRYIAPAPGTPVGGPMDRASFWIGIGFVALGALAAVMSLVQYRVALASLRPAEIPPGYKTSVGIWLTGIIALMGAALIAYLAIA